MADRRVCRVGRHRAVRRCRRHRDPRQPRRRRAVVPVAADQPADRFLRREFREPPPVPARDRGGDPRSGAGAVHVWAAPLYGRADRGRVPARRVHGHDGRLHRRAHRRLLQSRHRQQLGVPELRSPRLAPGPRMGTDVRRGQGRHRSPRGLRRARHHDRPGRTDPHRGLGRCCRDGSRRDGGSGDRRQDPAGRGTHDPPVHRTQRLYPSQAGGRAHLRLWRQPDLRPGVGASAATGEGVEALQRGHERQHRAARQT